MSTLRTTYGLNLLREIRLMVINPVSNVLTNYQQVRYRRTKHWDPKWKPLRRLKVIKTDLPNYNEKFEDLSEEEVRSKLKEQGLLPPRPWMERQFHISCTGGVFEGYIPPEGDGKVSSITAQAIKSVAMPLMCAYYSCQRRRKENPMMKTFKFPVQDSERLQRWILNSGNARLLTLEVDQLKNQFLCDVHFSDDSFVDPKSKNRWRSLVFVTILGLQKFVNHGPSVYLSVDSKFLLIPTHMIIRLKVYSCLQSFLQQKLLHQLCTKVTLCSHFCLFIDYTFQDLLFPARLMFAGI